jgi:hypothetical protein
MSKKKPEKLPKKLIQGKTTGSQSGEFFSGGGGKIQSNWQDIKWTPTKRIVITAVLIVPYLTAIAGCLVSGFNFIAYILIALAIMIGLLFWALRLIDKGDF